MMEAKRGQVALLMAFILAVIALFALLNIDTLLSVRAKGRVANAGDAAALAAARRQGELLNEIGRLNVEHVAAAARGDRARCDAIVLEQRRLALLGPLDALRRADEAARKNGMAPSQDFARILREHAGDVRRVYSGGGEDGDPYPEPYPGAWADYAAAIENACSGGLAAGPDNVEFLDAAGGHILLDRRFYSAIAGQDWCWFFFNTGDLLDRYSGFQDWAPLPERRSGDAGNSEIFSLRLAVRRLPLLGLFTKDEIRDILSRYGKADAVRLDGTWLEGGASVLEDPEEPWFFFDSYGWRTWFDGLALADDEDRIEFPLAGEIRPQYNVQGCAAACRTVSGVDALAVDAHSDFTWSAAAKPFGSLRGLDGAEGTATAVKSFVLPCFSEVRLVPIDAVDGADMATADAGWVDHVRMHLPPYLERGPANDRGCFYCMQLRTWENAAFRRHGVAWLKVNSGTCRRGTGGRGGHGGTARGH